MGSKKNKNNNINNKPKEPELKSNEFCSFNSRRTNTISDYYFGYNILDYYSQEDLSNLIKDPMGNNRLLRELSLQLYSTNGVFSNTVDYTTSLPTLDRVIISHGKNENKKRINKELMESTLKTIRDKEIVRDALFKGMIDGTAYYYFETTKRNLSNQKMLNDYDVNCITEINELGVNASIISLPPDFTRIVGIKNSSPLIAFNLDYFTNTSGEVIEKKLRKYPLEIRNAYHNKENLSGNWVVLDNNNTIVHKIKAKRDEPYGRPLVISAISDILYENSFLETKRNVLDEINNRIIYQTFPEGKDKGTSSLNKAQQEDQHNKVKNAVLTKNNRGGISFFSIASGTKINKIENESIDIFDSKNEKNLSDKISLDLGIAGSLLNGVGSGSYSAQTNNLELLSSQIFQWIDQIAAELNKCISANIIKDNKCWVECKYLPITHANKSSMVGYMKDLYLQAGGSMSAYIAACGISPEAYYALLDEEIEKGIYDKYLPHQTSYTLSSKDNEVGRPKTDNPSDNTVISNTYNGNNTPRPGN